MSVNVKASISAILFILAFDPIRFALQAHSASDVIAVQMERDEDHWMVGVRCQIGGSSGKWHLCVIDSGASHTIISDKVLNAEGPLVDITTGNGAVRAHARQVRFTIDKRLQFDSLALVQSDMTPSDIEILLGEDVLRQFRSVTFDYEKQEIDFHR
jgi:hypothetical protein